jgi:hypothetical protein
LTKVMPLAAIWFPPNGAGAQQGAPSKDQETGAAALKEREDRVAGMIDKLGDVERLIAYKYLHATGLRISTADHELRKALRREIDAAKK